MDGMKFVENNIKNISLVDWIIVEIVSILFGIGLVALFPQDFALMPWYFWLVIALLFIFPVFHVFSEQSKRKKNISTITIFRDLKKDSRIWIWPFTKMANMFLGITLAVLFPVILTYFAWYWWFVAVAILSAFPFYFVVIYAPNPKNKRTALSKKRAQYTRCKKPKKRK